MNILLQKVDADTGKPVPQGEGKLKGAQFTVRYYDTTDAWSISTDYATRVRAAKKTWVYETQEDGKIKLQVDSPISGDAVFTATDDFGNIVTTLPIGTYVIEETKAPAGFLLPNCQKRTFIEVVSPKANSDQENPDTYHTECYTPIKTDKYEGLGWNAWKINGEE